MKNQSPPASLWPWKHVKCMSIVLGVCSIIRLIPFDSFFWLLCRKEYTYTGLKHKKVNVQIQKNTSQAIPTTVARDCTIEMRQNSNVQQASYIIFPIFWISLVLLMQFLPHTFLHVVVTVVRMSAMTQPVLHNTLHSTLKTRFPLFECSMCFQNNPTSAQSHSSLR